MSGVSTGEIVCIRLLAICVLGGALVLRAKVLDQRKSLFLGLFSLKNCRRCDLGRNIDGASRVSSLVGLDAAVADGQIHFPWMYSAGRFGFFDP